MITVKTEIFFGDHKGLRQIQLKSPLSIQSLLIQLQLPQDTSYFINVNGSHQNNNYILQDGDYVKIIPFLEGG